MYSKQQKETALKLFKETQSVSETVRILGYPTKKHLHNWIYEEKILHRKERNIQSSIILQNTLGILH